MAPIYQGSILSTCFFSPTPTCRLPEQAGRLGWESGRRTRRQEARSSREQILRKCLFHVSRSTSPTVEILPASQFTPLEPCPKLKGRVLSRRGFPCIAQGRTGAPPLQGKPSLAKLPLESTYGHSLKSQATRSHRSGSHRLVLASLAASGPFLQQGQGRRQACGARGRRGPQRQARLYRGRPLQHRPGLRPKSFCRVGPLYRESKGPVLLKQEGVKLVQTRGWPNRDVSPFLR